MSEKNKSTLLQGNAAISAGNHEGFLELCTDDTNWEFVGDQTITGKQSVRQYLAKTYIEPPKFNVKDLIAEGEFVIAVGEIELKEKNGVWVKI
ncbi:nuclear transport factor 2 family protein [Pedobacter miscanthi]|jgi:ketosteroid isomerase-like protein|uniref:nuclear transport factor 2 family protein n=1 Tax=Pedobacter miscanthi TaxID=2259170 RepID=UPI00292DE455|nr:nuclear transport factor 2 family protein [Pedobacter miscanthi]